MWIGEFRQDLSFCFRWCHCQGVPESLARTYHKIGYSLQPIILFANIDIFKYILVVNTSILVKSNMDQREYNKTHLRASSAADASRPRVSKCIRPDQCVASALPAVRRIQTDASGPTHSWPKFGPGLRRPGPILGPNLG
jgi:hypothetical protein